MKNNSKKGLLILLLLFGIAFNALPYVIGTAFASSVNEIVTGISLVQTNDNISYKQLNDNDVFSQRDYKNYVKIDWEEKGIDVKPDDEFVVSVSGLLLENSANPYELVLKDDNNSSLPSIGTARVSDNKVYVKFNNNINSSEVLKYGKLKGSVYVRATADLNKFINNQEFTVDFILGSSTVSSLNLKHENLMPGMKFQYRDTYHSTEFKDSITNLLPSETMETKLTITPRGGYTINHFNLLFTFNDYSLDYFYGKKSIREELRDLNPSFNGNEVTDYNFVRESTDERRPDSIKDDDSAKLSVSSDWAYYPDSVEEFSEDAEFCYFAYVNHKYTDNAFQNYNYSIITAIDPTYKNETVDEIITDTPVEDVNKEYTNVIVKYIYNDGLNIINVIPDKIYDNVSLDSKQFTPYILSDEEVEAILKVNSDFYIEDIEQLYSLSKELDENIIYVHVNLCCKPFTTNVIVKFIHEDPSGDIDVIPERVYKDVPLDSTAFFNYEVLQEDKDAIKSKGYKIIKIKQLDELVEENYGNIIFVYCDLEITPTSPTPTTSTTSPTTSTPAKTSSTPSTPTTKTPTTTTRTPTTSTTTRTPTASTTTRTGPPTTRTPATTRTTTSSSTPTTRTTTQTATPPTTTSVLPPSTTSWVTQTDIIPDTTAPPIFTDVPETTNPLGPVDPVPPSDNVPTVTATEEGKTNPQTFDDRTFVKMSLIIVSGAFILLINKGKFLIKR